LQRISLPKNYRHRKIFVLFFFTVLSTNAQDLKRFTFSEIKMGAPFELIFYLDNAEKAQVLAKKSFEIIDSLNNAFSDYLPSSEISKLQSTHVWTPVSEDLFNILWISKLAYHKSEAAFDIGIGRLTKLWRVSKKTAVLSDKKTLKNAKKNSGVKYLKLDKNLRAVYLEKHIEIDLGGIGKGYAAQKILNYLKQQGLSSVLVNAAGNMALAAPPPEKSQWEIGIDIPEKSIYGNIKTLKIKDLAISTSGDAFQYAMLDGKKYSHILDPKTGLGLRQRKQVTILSTDAAQADWLSTACCILSNKKAMKLAKSENAEILIIETQKNKIKETASAGFSKIYTL
jgi:FAD:protein FMN transferase